MIVRSWRFVCGAKGKGGYVGGCEGRARGGTDFRSIESVAHVFFRQKNTCAAQRAKPPAPDEHTDKLAHSHKHVRKERPVHVCRAHVEQRRREALKSSNRTTIALQSHRQRHTRIRVCRRVRPSACAYAEMRRQRHSIHGQWCSPPTLSVSVQAIPRKQGAREAGVHRMPT